MRLPLKLPLDQMQTQWSAQLNPVISNLLINGSPLENIVLSANNPQAFNHGLGRNQIGWIITDQNSSASVFRTQPFNSQTITLEASASCTINIWCY